MAEIVRFDLNGGPLTIDIRCGFAQDGSYFVKEWNDNDEVQKWQGHFNDSIEDRYELPGEAKDHDGHFLQCRAEVGIVPPLMEHMVAFSIIQDGRTLATLTDTGKHEEPVLWPVSMWVELVGE